MSTPTKAAAPVIAILMPQAGNSMEEGTILKWRMHEGDRVTVGQVLYEVETDKASVDVEATDSGRIARIIAPEGAVIAVKQPVAYLAETDAELDAFLAEPTPESKAKTSQPQTPPESVAPASAATAAPPPTSTGRIKASPAARKLATEKGLDLARAIPGSGPGGRILSTDLINLQPSPHLPSATPAMPVAYFRQTIDAAPLLDFHQSQPAAAKRSLDELILQAVSQSIAQLPALHTRLQSAGHTKLAVSNLGHLGIEEFAAAIPPGECGILAAGAIREGVLAQGGVMYARRIMTLTLTVDARIIEPALAAAFMAKLKQTLEAPAAHLA